MSCAIPNLSPASPYRYERWLTEDEALPFAEYWNQEDLEKEKSVFWVSDGDFGKMERYLARAGRERQLNQALEIARRCLGRELRGVGCDLAAGALWAEPYLLRSPKVQRIYCVEYSHHRLLTMGPAVLSHYEIDPARVVLVLGDIHRLKLEPSSLDFVFMSAGFHHSESPHLLLNEMWRVLKPEGLVILIGEPIGDITWRHYIRQPVKFAISRFIPESIQRRILPRPIATRYFLPRPSDIIDTVSEAGDHYYSSKQYASMFSAAGFEHRAMVDKRAREQSFVLARRR